ncbi:MAG: CD1247 N-terminal domain-containing protein [Oscillospiraceae bacterium]|jgi:formylmethanofuran dehydrogenase subunit E
MTVSEKVAYLKGLAEGMGIFNQDTNEAKLFKAIIETLEDVGLSIADIEENEAVLGQEIDMISDDLADVEELLFGDEDEDEEAMYSVTCPSCGDEVEADEDILFEGSMKCPNCGEDLEFQFDEDDCDCGCCGPIED